MIYLEVRTEAVLRKPGWKLCYLDSQFSRLNKQCFVCFYIFNFQDLINSVSFLKYYQFSRLDKQCFVSLICSIFKT